jgi:Polyketide cyclase / dehydrase and lipid transport
VITILVCTTIAAPLDAVWRAIERIETHTEWMQDAVTITFESEQHEGVGTAFACLTRVGPLSTTDRFVVTAWEPPTLMAIEHRGAVKGDADFRLRAVDATRTEFCWEERLRFPWWLAGPLGEQVGRPVLRHIWQGNVDRLKAAVERR